MAGGGIAGVSAAVVLAERGIPVVICEAAERLGGRLGAHPRTLPDGTVHWVDHGFPGFFRQYYNWRQILGRIGAGAAALLHLLGSYPVISARWPDEEFDRLPPRAAAERARARATLAQLAAARPGPRRRRHRPQPAGL